MAFAKPMQVLRLRTVRWVSNAATSIGHDDVKPRGRGRPPHPFISTLNARLIQPRDYLDLSGLQRKSVLFEPFDAHKTGKRPSLGYFQANNGALPFPDHCAGFLYYHRAPNAAPLEGSLRFRIAADATQSSFSRGQDLLLPSGMPWQRLLPQLARPYSKALAGQLLRDNLVTAQQISKCREIFGDAVHSSLMLFRLDQEFPVNLGSDEFKLAVVGESLHKIRVPTPSIAPDVFGSLIVRFEPSTVDGRRVVHMRVIKIVTPVVCPLRQFSRQIVEPKEGQLLVVTRRGYHPRPWTYDLDRESSGSLGRALRALWTAPQSLQ
ncbi:hypothetical protein B0H16DRAFT_686877 [Mycena metata]|uniref:Uncharacterized protein n=1 Tax=Mycena metata TaxID=1033252 RepID=A0AAD7NDW7_9AGAR|nr:hypothetical protein B0H16DRAFT_686877 [Mycena metata]